MSRPYLLGLTGSIGMGKSTTAAMFADEGVPVWDADAAVHRLYSTGGRAVSPIRALYPDAVVDGAVDRARLKSWITDDPGALSRIEAAVHPLVAEDREAFVATTDAPVVLLDIPLLYETGGETQLDGVVVVSPDAATQRARVLSRPGMTEGDLDRILSRQVPDAEKRARADWVIPTHDLATARHAVQDVLRDIHSRTS